MFRYPNNCHQHALLAIMLPFPANKLLGGSLGAIHGSLLHNIQPSPDSKDVPWEYTYNPLPAGLYPQGKKLGQHKISKIRILSNHK